MNNYNRFSRATVNFGGNLTVDGYQMPDGEFRVGITGASLILGYSKEWLSQVVSRRPKTLKALQGEGFTGCQIEGIVSERDTSGASVVKTISLDDFNILIDYAIESGKKEAKALSRSLRKMTLLDFFRDAFGERPLSIEEKRALFYQEYEKQIDWQQEDKDDWAAIEEAIAFQSIPVLINW